MKELTQLEINAVYVIRAYANSNDITPFQRGVIWKFGTSVEYETENGLHRLRKWFGKLYAF